MSCLRVAAYAICKNEEKAAGRWMDSVKEADAVFVTDTGSTDATVEKLVSYGAVCSRSLVSPWRFDTARNISLASVPDDYDVCVCTDLDEVFDPGWRDKLENVWTPRTSRLCYMFCADSESGHEFWKEKIHKRHGFRWIRPVHEILEYCGEQPYCEVCEPAIRLHHYPDHSKPRAEYLPLLDLAVREDPSDDRSMHYLGREYMYRRMWDKCIETLKRHLEMPSALWKDERCASMRFIARSYKSKGDPDKAREWYYKAIAEAPYLKEPYVEMAKLGYEEKNWPCVFHMVEEALRINHRPVTYITEKFCRDSTIYDLGGVSCFQLGLFNQSYEYTTKAFEMSPYDLRLRNNLEIVKAKVGLGGV